MYLIIRLYRISTKDGYASENANISLQSVYNLSRFAMCAVPMPHLMS